jgi:hypothetical protein
VNARDRRAIFFGGGLLAAIAFVWLVLLPWVDHWSATRGRIVDSRQRLETFREQTQRVATLDRELEPLVGGAIKKPLPDLATARTQLIKDVTELHQNAGAEVHSVQPEAVHSVQQLPGVVRLAVQVQATCPPVGLVQLLAGARNSSSLLLVDRVEANSGQQGPGAMNVTTVWSTLARQEGPAHD